MWQWIGAGICFAIAIYSGYISAMSFIAARCYGKAAEAWGKAAWLTYENPFAAWRWEAIAWQRSEKAERWAERADHPWKRLREYWAEHVKNE